MNLNEHIEALVKLGIELQKEKDTDEYGNLVSLVEANNPWFTKDMINKAVDSVTDMLLVGKLKNWLDSYPKLSGIKSSKTVGIVMAGNIPLVGFHDMLCVLITGNKFIGKVSSKDKHLIEYVRTLLVRIDSRFDELITLTEDRLAGFDAIIATGSNNTSRYFEQYFGKYPNIIRKNRNSVAILTGDETEEELSILMDDVFLYYGLGCRNISKIYVPEGYDFSRFYEAAESYKWVSEHNKYANNYDYNRSIYLVNRVEHLDNGFAILTKEEGYASPISVIYYENYSDIHKLVSRLKDDREFIQCVVCKDNIMEDVVELGKAQAPELHDYADGIDTVEFLLSLK